jgi:chromosomal replication initiation ATPase DnaA
MLPRSSSPQSLETSLGPDPHSAIRQIAQDEANVACLTLAQLLGSSRERRLVASRHRAMWRAHLAGASCTQIARVFGNRDHTTVLYALKKARSGNRAVGPRP